MGIPKRRSRAEQAGDVRARLLAAARTVFLRDGYHATSLDEVVRTAGFTKGVVYSRFASKAELFIALLEERVEMRTAELPDPAREGARGVDAMVRQWLARTRENEAWALLVLEFRIAAARDPEVNARYAALHDRVVERVATQIRLATEAAGRSLTVAAEQLARFALGASNGLVLERAAGAKIPDATALAINARVLEAFQTASGNKRRRTG